MQLNQKSQNGKKGKKKKNRCTADVHVTGKSDGTQLTPHTCVMNGVGQNFLFSDFGIVGKGLCTCVVYRT